MPVYADSADQAASDARWLPRLAPHLPVEVPVPLSTGEPGEGYPFPWSVVPWLPGRTLDEADADRMRFAEDLADFVAALQQVDTDGGPIKAGETRGAPLSADWAVEEHLWELGDLVDGDRARAVWLAALDAGPWDGAPVWIHGDLLDGNLIVRDGRLAAVIDFGALGVADPAPDVVPAWTLFGGESRRIYRERLDVDDATWARARAWAMLPALNGLTYYAESVPAFAARSRRHLDAVLGDPTL
jgi:aminoglycoside phosphotransferase (APT) family kinase protein